MKRIFLLALAIIAFETNAQEGITYQKPPKEILELVDVPQVPASFIDDKEENIVFAYRSTYTSIEELAKTELRLAGLRIDPKTNIGSRVVHYNNLKIKQISGTNTQPAQVQGLPQKPLLSNFSFSPNQQKMAFTHTATDGLEVWVLDITTATAKRLTEPKANANLGDVINWFEGSDALLVKMVPEDRKPLIDVTNSIPSGPTVSVSDGKKAQNRTYQDLLKNKYDEHNFEQLAISELYRVTLNGKVEKWQSAAMYNNITFSPDGAFVLITTIEKPFSYLVPYSRFPSRTVVYTQEGKPVQLIEDVPLIENLPKGFMAVRTGRRSISWRSDQPATIIYVEALDQGDPEIEVPYRDQVFTLEYPFSGTPKSILKTINRYGGIYWGNDQIAIAMDTWWNTRNSKTYLFNPSDDRKEPVLLFDRNYQDRYNDPGNFVMQRNQYGSSVLAIHKNAAYLIGDGFSENGQFPFIHKLNLKNHQTIPVYQSEYTDKLENIVRFRPESNQMLVRIQSRIEYPNYYKKDLKGKNPEKLTDFENPFKSIEQVHKEVITYTREDGLELSGTLYLPLGYNKEKKEKMPMILWAYPREFKDQSSASQITQNPNTFTYLSYGSPVYWVTRGYVVLDNASFPIVGEGDAQPNDTYIKQLVANAKAAIDAVDKLGYIDRDRVAVGGHSYGAFMVANLLSHSDLFAAGIARSGAYNRTLTPFGFQGEERNYWEAPEVYYNMSPFMHADKMKTPLLMIHGEADNNSGTYPMQSERYFNALKGLGAPVRLVMLPFESHGYRAEESVLHVLWEQDQWLEKYVKSREL